MNIPMPPVQLPEVPALPRAVLSSPVYQLPPEWNAIIESELTARLAPSENNSER